MQHTEPKSSSQVLLDLKPTSSEHQTILTSCNGFSHAALTRNGSWKLQWRLQVTWRLILHISCQQSTPPSGDFPGSPGLNFAFQWRGWGSVPGQGAEIPHASWPKNQSIKQKQCCNKFSIDFKNGPRFKKKKNKVSATVRGGKRKTELAWGLASHMTAPAWLLVPGGPSHRGPSLPYTAALGTRHRHRRHSGPPARLLQGEACLCSSKRFPDTTEPVQAAANSQPGRPWWQTEHSAPRAQPATASPTAAAPAPRTLHGIPQKWSQTAQQPNFTVKGNKPDGYVSLNITHVGGRFALSM